MPNLDDMIAVATRHVQQGRRIVERQREMVAAGKASLDGHLLLKTFEQSLVIFEADLARLLEERREKEMPLGAMQAISLDESLST
jgi:hypothetical protein